MKFAEDGDRPQCGTVYVASPKRHLSITTEGTFQLSNGPLIHHLASSANPLFESAALAFGSNVVAVVLTGGDGDGSDGVPAVAKVGGTVIVQDPRTALIPEMPESAIRTGAVDRVLSLPEIAKAIVELTATWPRG